MTVPAFRMFGVRVAGKTRLSPTFLRLTFAGDELRWFADNGYDQRIKLLLPDAGGGYDHLPAGAGWYSAWRELPAPWRNPIRTYTVRAVRPSAREVDVDLALHGDDGLASRWASAAELGAEAALLGPDARYEGEHGGLEWRPAAGVRRVLLAGDETAVPAALGILERIPRHAVGEALLEVPSAGDGCLEHAAPPSLTVTWLVRDRAAAHGDLLLPAVDAAAGRLLRDRRPPGSGPTAELEDVDVDRELLWEVPGEPTGPDALYAWVAAEAGVVRGLRRLLVTGYGVDRGSAAFMGYWRRGRSDGE